MATQETADFPKPFGKYTILEFLGKGGMAEVYKAKLTGIGGFEKILVIKKILPHLAQNESFVKMFFDEANITVSLQHPNIVQVFELGQQDGVYYMAMEYVEGGNLNMLVRHCISRQIRIPFKHILYIIMEVCKGLYYAHRATDSNGTPLGIIHRDVTHSNILISSMGNVKLADFGIARARIQQSVESPDSIKGKLSYMAPEMIRRENIDHKVDIYSLGIVFFELLTLQKLFRGATDKEIITNILNHNPALSLREYPTIPDEIQEILCRAIANNSKDRYDSAQDLYNDLTDYCYNNSIKTSPHEFSDFFCQILHQKKSILGSEDEKKTDTSSSISNLSAIFKIDTTASQPKTPVQEEEIDQFKSKSKTVKSTPAAEKKPPPLPQEIKPAYAGEVKDFLIPRLISRIVYNKLTGELRIKTEEIVKSIFFLEGDIVSLNSNLESERIERFLIEATTLPLKSIEEAGQTSRGDGAILYLKNQKLLDNSELNNFLHLVYRERLANLVTRPNAQYEFFKKKKNIEAYLPSPLPAFSILTPSIRKGFDYKLYIQALQKHLNQKPQFNNNSKISIDEIFLTPREIEITQILKTGENISVILNKQKQLPEKISILFLTYVLYQYEIIVFS